MLRLVALACLLAASGCPDGGTCKHIAERCSNFDFCCGIEEGLVCQAEGERGNFCSKGCRCHGTNLCTPPSFAEGCPQGSVCLATDFGGKGKCIVLCNQSPCAEGQYRCIPEGDAGAIRCEVVVLDAGADAGAGDLGLSDFGTGADAARD